MTRDSDTHPKDGDVEQTPLVSGAGLQGIAARATLDPTGEKA